MSLYSKQIFYCRACGKSMYITINAQYGAQFCDKKCYDEFNWRRALSILGKEYYPQLPKNDEEI